jgi:(p)ppGpp synthase/HD superfamily hydrolase
MNETYADCMYTLAHTVLTQSGEDEFWGAVMEEASGFTSYRRRHGLAQMARKFADERHAGQKYNGTTYTFHLAAVEKVLTDFGYYAPQWVAVAWLHDVLEDTKTTFEELEETFGMVIAGRVDDVTGRGANRRERNSDILRKIQHSPNSAILKIADRIANVEYCANNKYGPMYLTEREAFGEVVYPLVPPAMTARLEAAYAKLVQPKDS